MFFFLIVLEDKYGLLVIATIQAHNVVLHAIGTLFCLYMLCKIRSGIAFPC